MSELIRIISNAIRAERKRARMHRGSNGADCLAKSVAKELIDKKMLCAEAHNQHLASKRN